MHNLSKLGQEIFDKKYSGRFKGLPTNYYKNLARLVSLGDPDLAEKFSSMLLDGRFSPGGRILAYAGRETARTSLMNCTTHKVADDSLEAISDTVKQIMLASSRGQGIGIDLSSLRPKDAQVNNAAKTSTGAVSFMELLNHVGATIGQEGRRAALLFSLRVDHPDLWREDGYDFLHIKEQAGKVESANISVMITDDFMEAVRAGDDWDLEFEGVSAGETFHVKRTVKARALFEELATCAWKAGEPGVLFVDEGNRMSNSDLFGFPIVGVNACSEMLLDQDGVCNLGSLNLAKYVLEPFTSYSHFDYVAFGNDATLAVEFLDNILELELSGNRSVNETQRRSVEYLRRVGLGVMGLADALAMLGLHYDDSVETLTTVESIFRSLRNEAYTASIDLAVRKGPCKAWAETDEAKRAEIVNEGFYQSLPGYMRQAMVKHGLRNVTLLSIAPTGSISNVLGVSGGIEPLFALEYIRRVRMDGQDKLVTYVHPGVEQSRAMGLPDSIWDTAYSITPRQHVTMQAAVQQYVDSSIAKTVNLPASATIEDVEKVYMQAWMMGLKGCTVYRDASREVQVLYKKEEERCPECGEVVVKQGGCTECPSCGWGKCDK